MAHYKHLDAESVAHYEREGFLSPIDIVASDEVASCRGRLEAYEAKLGEPVSGHLRTKPHLLFEWVDTLMRNDTLLDCVEDLMGPDILVWNTWFWIKERGAKSYVSWHQDNHYWGLDTDRLVTAWLALSPASVAAGCMSVLPGTHKGAPLPHADLYHEDNLLTRGQEIVELDESKAVAMPLLPGQVSLHNIGVAHASGPNLGDDRRIGLSMHFIPPSARQTKADWDCATLVRGRDDYGHFDSSPAPAYDGAPEAVAYHKRATDAMRALLFQDAERVRATV